jgi:small nuclear ribonucleoprotein (snRNP)-like protein
MKRLLQSALLTFMLIVAPLSRLVRAQNLTESTSAFAKIKTDIIKRLKDGLTNVTVKLRNGSELKGRITQRSETMFTLREDKTLHNRDIGFGDVSRIRSGRLSQGAKLSILTSIIAGSVVLGALMSLKNPQHSVAH